MRPFYNVFLKILLLTFALQGVLRAQPNWEVSSGEYASTMNITAKVLVDSLFQEGPTILAAFVGEECRGIASLQEDLFFLTAYSNEAREEMSLRIYHESTSQILDASNNLSFSADGILGDSEDPYQVFVPLYNDRPPFLDGLPDVQINEGNSVSLNLQPYLIEYDGDALNWEVLDLHADFSFSVNDSLVLKGTPNNPYWNGTDTVLVRATDQNTEQAFFAQDTIVIEIRPIDSPLSIDSIVVEPILEGGSFPSINLSSYIREHDGDEYELTATSDDFSVSLTGELLEVEMTDPNWFGLGSVQIKAQDISTSEKLTTIRSVFFQVSGVDDPPVLLPIPQQLTERSQFFLALDLRNYLEELDQDALIWSSSGSNNLLAEVSEGFLLTITQKDPLWEGLDSVKIRVQDNTENAFFDEAWVFYGSGNILAIEKPWPWKQPALHTFSQRLGVSFPALPQQGLLTITVWDAKGQLLERRETIAKPNEIVAFQTTKWPSALYLISCQTGSHFWIGKWKKP